MQSTMLRVVLLMICFTNAFCENTVDNPSIKKIGEYHFNVDDEYNWYDAMKYCSNYDMELVKLDSESAEINLIEATKKFGIYGEKHNFWIGRTSDHSENCLEWINDLQKSNQQECHKRQNVICADRNSQRCILCIGK
ncbi:uncharacterized protein LOC116346380 [Contarinia nasturtii]|uniref:uncharacterized protein LOC116346380 n=1 Tax=Contarinia nasturtii TaxID=265458 RepID=UPI0012D4923D|nr:uncharacterized protein LOC116346380 [Contarinia nasturtii]